MKLERPDKFTVFWENISKQIHTALLLIGNQRIFDSEAGLEEKQMLGEDYYRTGVRLVVGH